MTLKFTGSDTQQGSDIDTGKSWWSLQCSYFHLQYNRLTGLGPEILRDPECDALRITTDRSDHYT